MILYESFLSHLYDACRWVEKIEYEIKGMVRKYVLSH